MNSFWIKNMNSFLIISLFNFDLVICLYFCYYFSPCLVVDTDKVIFKKNKDKFGILETLYHSFKLKIMLNTTTALFVKVVVHVVKTMPKNPWEILFQNGLNMKTQLKQQLKPAKHLKYFPDHQFESKLGLLNTRGKGKF